jgi:hypothetical protein
MKYKIVCIGNLVTEHNGNVCLGVIGYGPTVCIRKNCHTNHLGGKSDLNLNNICVIKVNETSLFAEPTMLREHIDTGLFKEWVSDKATLEEWAEHFGSAVSSKEVLSEVGLKDLATLKEMARNFKTPLKASQEPTNEEVAEMVSLVKTLGFYKHKITTMNDMGKLSQGDNSFLIDVIHGMEEKLEEISRKCVISEAASEQLTKKICVEILILFTKTGTLEASIGKRLKHKMPGSEAPTVWSLIASLYKLLHETQSKVQDVVTMSSVLSNEIKEDVTKFIDQKFASKGLCKQLKNELSQDLSQYI